jgi:hypothetical protein
MRVRFHVHTYKNPNVQEARVIIKFLNNKDKEIAAIKQVYHVGGLMGVGSGYNYYLSYRLNDEWKKQGIQKNDIIKEIEADFHAGFEGILKLPLEAKFGVYTAFIYYKKLLSKLKKTPSMEIKNTRIRVSDYQKFGLLAKCYVNYRLNLL